MNRAGKMNNDHLTAPMLSAAMDEVIRLRIRVEALEAALREIANWPPSCADARNIARAALDPATPPVSASTRREAALRSAVGCAGRSAAKPGRNKDEGK